MEREGIVGVLLYVVVFEYVWWWGVGGCIVCLYDILKLGGGEGF